MSNHLLGVFIAVLAVMLVGRASASEPVEDQWGCEHSSAICLTSFKWCSRSRDYSKGCSLPEDTYPYYSRDPDFNAATVMWDMRYNLTWQKADPDYPVLLQWHFGGDSEPYSWMKNLTSQETPFEFSFKELVEEFSTSLYDPKEIKYQVIKTLSIFSISQPERSNLDWAFSDQFSVVDSATKPHMLTQRSDTQAEVTKQWKRGIGIGAGIGALLLIVMAVAFWYLRKKGNEREPAGVETRRETHGQELTERSADLDSEERWAGDGSARRAHILYR
ncbi:hypothetical protein AK830_g11526 [Neonectria ditissima]|uniref:Mid2 domain-containing protein n=1 Tax=Neonectria ditissima TaxID=78410 RepID=A0A0P7B4W6_9HYPO|nr:hypothetical protein AK830_g11526 [Neonectria ditissima]